MNQLIKYLWALIFFSVTLGVCYLGFVGIKMPQSIIKTQLPDDKFPN